MTERQQHTNTAEAISLKEIILKIQGWWQYLLSKWIIIVALGLLGGVLGFWYAKTKKTVYTATTTFVLEDEKLSSGGLGSLAGLASMAGVDVGSGGGIFQGDNIIELYKSHKMIVKTLLTEFEFSGKKQSLIERYIQYNNLRKGWKGDNRLQDVKFFSDSIIEGQPALKSNRIRDSIMINIVADIAMNYLSVSKPDKKLSIVKVDVKSTDEAFAKNFNDGIVKNVNDFYLQTKTKKSVQNVKIIQRKTDSVRAVMNGAIYSGVAIADATPNLNPTRQVQRIAPAQRAQFSAETNKAILSSLVQNLEMSKLSLMKETPLLVVVDMPMYPLNATKVGKLKSLILGGVLFSFLSVIFLTIKKFIYDLMKN